MPSVNVRSAIQNSVPISNFNKGMAGKIFAEVRHSGAKVVIKNNVPECVLMSPDEYISMLDELEDMRLLLVAEKRLPYDANKLVSNESVMNELSISQEDLDNMEDVEIE